MRIHVGTQGNNSPLIIGSTEWALASKARHVYVVFNHHNVPHAEVWVQATSCIGHNQNLHTQEEEHSDRVGHLSTEEQLY